LGSKISKGSPEGFSAVYQNRGLGGPDKASLLPDALCGKSREQGNLNLHTAWRSISDYQRGANMTQEAGEDSRAYFCGKQRAFEVKLVSLPQFCWPHTFWQIRRQPSLTFGSKHLMTENTRQVMIMFNS
jgi:hypothetical protein